MALKCDLQYGKGEAAYKLTRVGVKGYAKYLEKFKMTPMADAVASKIHVL